MTNQPETDELPVPLALAEPTVHVRPGWITGLSLASLGMWMASLTPIQVLLPIQLQDIDNKTKLLSLGLVSGLGAVASVLATPIAGALSGPRTRSASAGSAGAGTAGRWPWPR
jgi:hypothetical protein